MAASPLLETLRIVEALSRSPASVDALATHVAVSVPTVKRYINEARLLGADIRSTRSGKLWLYELRNADAVMPRALRWIDLEQARNLVLPIDGGGRSAGGSPARAAGRGAVS